MRAGHIGLVFLMAGTLLRLLAAARPPRNAFGDAPAYGAAPAYAVSKAALNALTRVQAAAAPGVWLGAACPGDVLTRMAPCRNQGRYDTAGQRGPGGGLAEAGRNSGQPGARSGADRDLRRASWLKPVPPCCCHLTLTLTLTLTPNPTPNPNQV
eukprot:scaffold38709_cov56-Phaeocystis_antarctica.AAC.2